MRRYFTTTKQRRISSWDEERRRRIAALPPGISRNIPTHIRPREFPKGYNACGVWICRECYETKPISTKRRTEHHEW